jgi:hypothetical protein
VHLEPLSLQQVMVHAAGRTSETTKEKTNA